MASIRQKLLEAIKAGKPQQVREALKTADGSTPLRSATGEIPLHEAVRLSATPEVFKILLEGITDFSARNIDGQTVADLVFSTENLDPDYETILVNHVKAWILRGRVDELEKLLLSGWVFWPVSVDQAKNVSAELCDFISKIRDVQVSGGVNFAFDQVLITQLLKEQQIKYVRCIFSVLFSFFFKIQKIFKYNVKGILEINFFSFYIKRSQNFPAFRCKR